MSPDTRSNSAYDRLVSLTIDPNGAVVGYRTN
jgi:hypothetical protein